MTGVYLIIGKVLNLASPFLLKRAVDLVAVATAVGPGSAAAGAFTLTRTM